MSAPKIAIVYYTYKTYSDGTHPIMIRITASRKSRYISTGYSVKPENWDDENNCLYTARSNKMPGKKALSNAKAINSGIELKYHEAMRAKQQVSLADGSQTSQHIKDKVTRKYNASSDFLVYISLTVDIFSSNLLKSRFSISFISSKVIISRFLCSDFTFISLQGLGKW